MASLSTSYAGVEWASHELKLDPVLGSSAVDFAFNFKNTGNLPVQFESPVASCGCTLVKWDKAVYAPGESGALKGIYDTKGRRGLGSVTITIGGAEVDNDVRRPFSDRLNLIVFIPEIVKITPGITLWRKGSEEVTKTIRFQVNGSLALPLSLVSFSKAAFVGKWITVSEGKIYELTVTPITTAEAEQAVVTVEGVDKDGKILRFYTHLMIR